jgi:hypothetical protein
MKNFVWLALVFTLAVNGATAKRPQILPEPMLVNLFALTEASATLQICAESGSYDGLPPDRKALLQRLHRGIDTLVRKIARKYDDDLFPFFVQSRDDAAKRPDRIETIRKQYGYCGNGMLERMKRYVYDSRRKLDYFLSQQPDAR